MKNAFEWETEEYSGGKLRRRKCAIGGVVIWAVVVLVFCLSGHWSIAVPGSLMRLWQLRAEEAPPQLPMKKNDTVRRVGKNGKRKGQVSSPTRSSRLLKK
jgi:hypothetical protein